MSEIRAVFEAGSWRDFSEDHKALRFVIEQALETYEHGRNPDPIAVWGAYGAGKTQFLFWVAEQAVEKGFVPVYFHLNDLLNGLDEGLSPDEFGKHATAFVDRIVAALHDDEAVEPFLIDVYRDEDLLKFIVSHIKNGATTPVLLIDEVEQVYITLTRNVRADDRSPLRAWLEEGTFKVFAFAVGSLYVLGRADRERLNVLAIPPVQPQAARSLCEDLPPYVVNGIWWLSRGKPRHFMKAVSRYRLYKPATGSEIYSFVTSLDSVSQAPYEGESQSAVPAVYLDQLNIDEVPFLLAVAPKTGGTEGKLFPIGPSTQEALLPILQDAFKLQAVVFHLARYVMMLADAVSVDGYFALTERDTPYLLRMAVDFLLEYERERLEQDTIEGNAALRKLLEVHDRAAEKAGEVFWKLYGRISSNREGEQSISFETLASAFPLPTTSPTLFGTEPVAIRTRFEEQKQPVFSWTDPTGSSILFLTSVASLYAYSSSMQFRQAALSPSGGVLAILPHDSEDWRLTGLLDWLAHNNRLRVSRLPLALTDFLLSLRAFSSEGQDPFSIAEGAEADKNLKRQVAFYRTRLDSFVKEMSYKPGTLVPTTLPTTLKTLEGRVADKANFSMVISQAFESMTPTALAYLSDLRAMVEATGSLWDRKIAPGFVALAEAFPHRSPRTGRPEPAKMLEDVTAAFSTFKDALSGLASYIDVEDMAVLAKDRTEEAALRALWQAKRGASDESADLNPASRQLLDVVRVLKDLSVLERRLREAGFVPAFGDLAVLLEAYTLIDTVSKNAQESAKGRATADRQLARMIYARFIQGFLANIESDVSKAKVAMSKVTDTMDEVAGIYSRLTEIQRNASIRFAGIEEDEIEKLAEAVVKTHLAKVSGAMSLDEILLHYQDILQSLEETEAGLNDLSDAYDEIWATVQNVEHADEC